MRSTYELIIRNKCMGSQLIKECFSCISAGDVAAFFLSKFVWFLPFILIINLKAICKTLYNIEVNYSLNSDLYSMYYFQLSLHIDFTPPISQDDNKKGHPGNGRKP